MSKVRDEVPVVHYKIYLCAAGYEPEIRRITIDKDISHNYFYLKQKLICIFPTLKDVPFTISWKDREGDLVRICTDEELTIAIREMDTGNFKKVYVSTTPKQGSEGPLHPNVYCDGCEHVIQGFRYKCIVCPDFDLCPDCERSQNHPDHPMIRIPLPLSPEMPFSRRFGRDLSRMSKHLDYLLRQSEKVWGDNKGGRGDIGGGHHHSGKRNNGDKKHKSCPFAAYSQVPEGMLKTFFDFLDNSVQAFAPPAEVNSTATEQQPSSAPNNETSTNLDEQKKFVEILRQGLTSFIDPLGADISPSSPMEVVREAAPEPASSNEAGSSTVFQQSESVLQPQVIILSQSSQPTPQTQPSQPMPQPQLISPAQLVQPIGQPQLISQAQLVQPIVQPQAAQRTPQPPPVQILVQPTASELTQQMMQNLEEGQTLRDVAAGGDSGPAQEPRYASFPTNLTVDRREHSPPTPVLDNSWTVINNREVEQVPRESESQSHSEAPSSADSNEVPRLIYPAIPVMPINSKGENLIDETMARMLAMGFTDDGGWLRQLVESKQGSIEEVLRFLSPIPKPPTKKH